MANKPSLEKFHELSAPESTPLVLQLTEGSENPSTANYVAVSYCWNQSDDDLPRREYPKFVIEAANGRRPNKAPRNILTRALRYALEYHVPFVWIDQECISQDDPTDKEIGIQSMDIVYARSDHPVGILNNIVTSEAVATTLATLKTWKGFGHREFVSLCQKHLNSDAIYTTGTFLDKLQEDQWFSRAWIHQESACARDSMLLLLIHKSEGNALGNNNRMQVFPSDVRKDGAEKSASRGREGTKLLTSSSPKDIEIPSKHLNRWPRALRDARESRLYPITSLSAYSNPQDAQAVTNRSLQILWQAGEQLIASNIIPQLERKGCTIVSDRLAIMANSCNYQRRLNIPAVEKAGYHFSTCALTLAIMNGDVNPWPEYADSDSRQMAWVSPVGDRPHVKKTTLAMIAPEFLVLWNRTYGSRQDVLHDHPRLPGVRLDMDGFRTRGWLWVNDRQIKIDTRTWRDIVPNLLNSQSDPLELMASVNQFCIRVLRALHTTKLPRVADAFLKTLRDGQYIPSPPRTHETASIFPLVARWQEAPWFIRFIKHIIESGLIEIARLVEEGDETGLENYSAMFPTNGKSATHFFTSTDHDLDELREQEPLGLSNFYCIEVDPKPDDPTKEKNRTLAYCGSWNRGSWYAPSSAMREYLFPWHTPVPSSPISTCRGNVSWNTMNLGGPNDDVLFGAGI
jgi:Heterokaryon incompatibility protein (HET)